MVFAITADEYKGHREQADVAPLSSRHAGEKVPGLLEFRGRVGPHRPSQQSVAGEHPADSTEHGREHSQSRAGSQ